MNVAATTAAEGFPRRAFTVDDVSRMIEAGVIREDEKFELIEGEIVMMAAKGVAHERIKSALNIAVIRALPGHLTIGVAATLQLTNMIMLEPDIAVFPKELFKKSSKGFARLAPGEAHLVIEVAVSSLAYDKGLKARLYARHGVRDFGWSTPTRAPPGCIPAPAAMDGHRSLHAGRTMRSSRRRCPAFRCGSERSTERTARHRSAPVGNAVAPAGWCEPAGRGHLVVPDRSAARCRFGSIVAVLSPKRLR